MDRKWKEYLKIKKIVKQFLRFENRSNTKINEKTLK